MLALVLAATVVMGSPGPATISVTAIGAAFGLRNSLHYTSGIILGTVAVLLVVATGIKAILTSMPGVAPVLAVASAAYILYLACRIATAPPLAARDSSAVLPTFLGGLLLAVANPKAYVAIAAVLAGSATAAGADALGIPARLAVLTLMIVAIHVLSAGRRGLRPHPAPAAGVADHQSGLRGDAGADHGAGGVALSRPAEEIKLWSFLFWRNSGRKKPLTLFLELLWRPRRVRPAA
ncbi:MULTISPECIES: LysE family transporter [unclassified Mesorhizobium]|uniref:LysE family translocator n=1 Tax=unclassified Mesorhizobium TaxID=325217 RepID=UPI003338B582